MAKASGISPNAGRLPADQRRDVIIGAAMTVFAGRPFDTVRMEDVSEQAGISKALLYKHFPGKSELYVEVVRTIARQLEKEIAMALQGRALDERLGAAIGTFTEFAERNRDLFVSLFQAGMRGDPAVMTELQRVREAIEELVLAGHERTASVAVGVRGVMGFVEAATFRWLELAPGTMSALEAAFLIETVLRAGLERVNGALEPRPRPLSSTS